MSSAIEKTVKGSQGAQASGPSTSTEDEFRFVAKSGDYATPWRSTPKGGIAGEWHKLKPEQKAQLGSNYSLQLRGPSVRQQLDE